MEEMTKILGQPLDNDVTKLQKELGQIVQKVHTTFEGKNHGHLELIMEEADYWAIWNGGVAFISWSISWFTCQCNNCTMRETSDRAQS